MCAPRYPLLITALLLTLTSLSTQAGEVSHIVMVWLKPEISAAETRRIMAATASLQQIPSVTRVQTGTPITSDRDIVDDSFSFGITITLASAELMEEYLQHPLHKTYVEKYIKGKAAKLLIYDY